MKRKIRGGGVLVNVGEWVAIRQKENGLKIGDSEMFFVSTQVYG